MKKKMSIPIKRERFLYNSLANKTLDSSFTFCSENHGWWNTQVFDVCPLCVPIQGRKQFSSLKYSWCGKHGNWNHEVYWECPFCKPMYVKETPLKFFEIEIQI